MKVELDLSTEQLETLDKNLSELLLSLTDDQKIKLIQGYMNDKFDKFYERSPYGTCDRLSKFGEKIVDGLQEVIANVVTEEMFETLKTKKEINDHIEAAKDRIGVTVDMAISKYIIDNLFLDKEHIRMEIYNQLIRRN